MDIFDLLTLIGGLCLFLFGMSLMGEALERSAGSRLEGMLGRLTSGRLMGFVTGVGVTAVIQSSSATTVMVVGFVNSGLMTLRQAIHVIMGANLGTTVTAWVLSLGGISGDRPLLQFFKPTSFTPLLALIGIVLYLGGKSQRKKDAGIALLSFGVLMFGMDTMSDAVKGLADVPFVRNLFLLFENPLLGVLVGAIVTALIQSSSASVGILQALAQTGSISFGAAVPIIMGQNVGTCVTALVSSLGTNRNAKRAALLHLLFNVLGTAVWLTVFSLLRWRGLFPFLEQGATSVGIASAHTVFNLACAVLLFPFTRGLERLVCRLIPNKEQAEPVERLDERLLASPAVALERCRVQSLEMLALCERALEGGLACVRGYDAERARGVRRAEEQTDLFEDAIGRYLIKLSARPLDERQGAMASVLLKAIGDMERIGDHAVNLVEAAEEMKEKRIALSDEAREELDRLMEALQEIARMSFCAVREEDAALSGSVEALEQVIDELRVALRDRHIHRLRQGKAGMAEGFVWSDLLTDMERIGDHCTNLAAYARGLGEESLARHRGRARANPERYAEYAARYLSPL